ncbi:MAG: bifunctional diaminohydroxyphosphoribosylaminopyrimidine deaminase/5-amino-6-(5-phosphoribosylamino)uracil reductase RibD [Candidatus Micrarchaeota archaeon]
MDRFMRMALSLARRANPFPNPRVGAVLVKEFKTRNGKLETRLLGSGYHKAPGRPHAEIEAIEDAKRRTGNPEAPRGATLYVTLEPCSHTIKRTPPCTGEIIRCGISRVVYGMDDPNPLVSGAAVLRNAGVKVDGPAAAAEAAAINRRYSANISKKPLVTLKMAMSADGKTATRTGDSKWISGPEARALVHRMRFECDAVVVGAETVIHDDPGLTSHGRGRDPFRIVVDGRLRIPVSAKVLANPDGKTIVATTELAPRRKVGELARNSEAQVFVCGKDSVGLGELVDALGAMGMKRILIEGGSELNAKALEEGIVDRLALFIAPMVIGGREAKGVVGGIGIGRIGEAIRLRRMKMTRIGPDYLLEAEIIR